MITPQQLAKARFALDLLQMRPERAAEFVKQMGMHQATVAAYERGLQDPVKFRQWAQGVVDQWRKEQR